MWLLLFFVVIPLIEIALFIQVGGLIGLWPTLGLVLLSAVVGVMLMRSQGAQAWVEVQRSVSELRDPGRPLAHGALILIAGLLLVMPGFFSDALGLLLLIPPVREAVMNRVSRNIRMQRHDYVEFGPRRREPHRPPFDDGIIDADYTVEADDPRNRPPAPHGAVPGPDHVPPRRNGSGWTH